MSSNTIEYDREWRKKNFKRIRLYRKRYKKRHPDKIREARKRYRQRHPEIKQKLREYNRKRSIINTRKMMELRKYKGNKCQRCGYNEKPQILVFHHLPEFEKEFGIREKIDKDIEILKEEMKKCILICPNCHAIIHLKDD